ncbi:hypothetical protein ES705_08742 [subsurface metagenome]
MFRFLRIIAAIFLFVAIGSDPYSYYIILRIITCGVSLCGIWYAYRVRKFLWLWVFSAIAVLFNPIIPIYLKKDVWIGIDLAVIIVFLISIPLLKAKVKGDSAKVKSISDFLKNKEQYKESEKRPDREIKLWKKSMSRGKLKKIHRVTISELSKMRITNWEDYALKAVCTHSPSLKKLLIKGNLDIKLIKASEQKGLDDAIIAIKKADLDDAITLRGVFHKIFKTIYRDTSYAGGNKFYWYGRDRVIQMLRSFRASTRKFMPSDAKFYDIDGEEFKLDTKIDADTVQRVYESLDYLHQRVVEYEEINRLKKHYKFKIESEYPVIEFDLEAIENTGNFKYEGSLVNCLFIKLARLLYLASDYTCLETRAVSKPLYDCEVISYAYEAGIAVLVKYKGVVEYFPDRLYVELQDIDLKSGMVIWLKSYKLHIEGND